MTGLAIIGGTGLTSLSGLEVTDKQFIETPFGQPSSALFMGRFAGKKVVFLPRHGEGHTVPPHKINYRANLWALKHAGISKVISIAAVGGIHDDLAPGTLAVPEQIIDYTYGREQSFYSDNFSPDKHLDFSYPYTESLRKLILDSADKQQIAIKNGGVYGATQGPRLETAAEIKRLKQDGCDMVGMTGMPEAYLARELGIDYACCALMVNWAAGLSDGVITMKHIEQTINEGMTEIKQLLAEIIQTQ
ncbi:MAG: 5'-methylthioadenosine phosphorylase [Gammaproteobacteria bacterium]|nr:MAG: 5'-methylthioadenosine phosphorylase [Gammaproteobacteria bacterium]